MQTQIVNLGNDDSNVSFRLESVALTDTWGNGYVTVVASFQDGSREDERYALDLSAAQARWFLNQLTPKVIEEVEENLPETVDLPSEADSN